MTLIDARAERDYFTTNGSDDFAKERLGNDAPNRLIYSDNVKQLAIGHTRNDIGIGARQHSRESQDAFIGSARPAPIAYADSWIASTHLSLLRS